MRAEEVTEEKPSRAKRVSAEVVRARMIDAAREALAEDGLSVGFDHLPMEEYIKRAGVPRSSVYRIWSTREEFVAALIAEMFSAERYANGFDPTALQAMFLTFEANKHRLVDAAGRKSVVHEMIRVGTEINFKHLSESAEWASYNTLVASFTSLRPGPTYDIVAEVVTRIEAGFAARMADFYAQMIANYGARLRDGCTPDQIAALTAVVVEGFAQRVRRGSTPLNTRITVPGLDDEPTDWHLVAWTVRSIVDGMITDYDGPVGS